MARRNPIAFLLNPAPIYHRPTTPPLNLLIEAPPTLPVANPNPNATLTTTTFGIPNSTAVPAPAAASLLAAAPAPPTPSPPQSGTNQPQPDNLRSQEHRPQSPDLPLLPGLPVVVGQASQGSPARVSQHEAYLLPAPNNQLITPGQRTDGHGPYGYGAAEDPEKSPAPIFASVPAPLSPSPTSLLPAPPPSPASAHNPYDYLPTIGTYPPRITPGRPQSPDLGSKNNYHYLPPMDDWPLGVR